MAQLGGIQPPNNSISGPGLKGVTGQFGVGGQSTAGGQPLGPLGPSPGIEAGSHAKKSLNLGRSGRNISIKWKRLYKDHVYIIYLYIIYYTHNIIQLVFLFIFVLYVLYYWPP